MHIFLVVALIVGFIYSLLKLHKNIVHTKIDSLVLFVILKILTAICLFIFINGSMFMFKNNSDDTKFLLSLQLLTYTIGDVFILWNEILAITFFGMGHVFFLNLFMFHQFIEVVTHPILAFGLIVIPSAVFYCLPNKYKDSHNLLQILHKSILIVYMLLLYLVWMMPTFHWYFPGMLLFVVSDLFIVFQWPGAWFAEYMLYLGSLGKSSW